MPTLKTSTFHGPIPVPPKRVGLELEDIVIPHLNQYIGHELHLTVHIVAVEDIPSKLCKNVFVAFKWLDLPDNFISPVSEQTTVNHKFQYHTTVVSRIDEELLEYLERTPLEFEVYGNTPSSCSNFAPEQVLLRAAEPVKQLEEEDEEDSKAKRKRRKKELVKLQQQLEKQTEQLAIQENTLAENTQELEQSLHQVDQLTKVLEAERRKSRQLETNLKKMTRQNDILKDKIKALFDLLQLLFIEATKQERIQFTTLFFQRRRTLGSTCSVGHSTANCDNGTLSR